MTYPPQPPGPPGQQPDPYGQQPYGQQQPYGDPYGQQGGYGQQSWAAVPPGYAGPPKKSKSGLIAALIIVGILVLGGGGVGIYLLAKDDDSGSGTNTSGPADNNPQAIAERLAALYEQVINTDLAEFDTKQWEQVVCASDFDDLSKDYNNTKKLRESRGRQPSKRPPDKQVDVVVKDLNVDGDSGKFILELIDPTVEEREKPKPKNLELQKENGRWVACGLYDKKAADRPPTSKSPRTSR